MQLFFFNIDYFVLYCGLFLVARPHFDVHDVSAITKSPRFAHFHTRRQRSMNSRLKQINKGFFTPEAAPKPIDSSSFNSPSIYSDMFSRGLNKIRSLDFSSSTRQEQKVDKRNMDIKRSKAQIYRAQILEQKRRGGSEYDLEGGGKTGIDTGKSSLYSPGFQREEKSIQMSSKRKEHADAHGSSIGDEKATFSQCVFNMANILMGVGLLGLPFVMKSAGFIGGILILVIFAAITWRTSILIGRELNGDPRPSSAFDDSPFKSPLRPGASPLARMRSPLRSFPDIAREAFGDKGCVMLASVLYFELFSCLGIFLVSLGEHMHELFPSVSVQNNMVLIAIMLTIPTAVLRTPRLLSYLSAVGTVATLAVVLSVVFSAILCGNVTMEISEREGLPSGGHYHEKWKTTGIPLALGLVAYSFSGHAIVPSIYTSMKNPQEFDSMITFTFIIVLCSCILVASAGYYMFGDLTVDQVTLSIAEYNSNGGMAWLTWLMVITAFSKFTLTMFPLALGIEEIVAPYIFNEESAELIAGIIRVTLIALALLVAIFFPSFSFLCSLVGLLCTMVVSVIFPAAAHLALFSDKISFTEKAIDHLFIIFGVVAAVVGTIATVI